MIIRWPWLLLALAFLTPPPVFSSEIRRVLISARRNATLSVASLVRPWQNWVDLARASLGTLILIELAVVLEPSKDVSTGPKPLLFQLVFLAVALLFQTTRFDTKASRS